MQEIKTVYFGQVVKYIGQPDREFVVGGFGHQFREPDDVFIYPIERVGDHYIGGLLRGRRISAHVDLIPQPGTVSAWEISPTEVPTMTVKQMCEATQNYWKDQGHILPRWAARETCNRFETTRRISPLRVVTRRG